MRTKMIFAVAVLALFCLSLMTVKVSAKELEIEDLRGRCDEMEAGLEDIRGRFDEIENEIKPEVEIQVEFEIRDLENELKILDDIMVRRGDQAGKKEKQLMDKLLRKIEQRKHKLEPQIERLER